MLQRDAVIAVVVGAGLTALLEPIVITWLSRRSLVDHPNHRSSHERPTPRGGGIALAGAALVAGFAAGLLADRVGAAIVLAGVGAAMVGVAEDLRGVSIAGRAGLHVGVVALAIVAWWSTSLTGWQASPVVAVASGIGLVAFIHIYNFMDGINGISGFHALAAAGYYAWAGVILDVDVLVLGAAAIGGVAVAFLPFNVPVARVFLGDSGSYLLGGWLGALAVVALCATGNVLVAGAPLLYYVADTIITMSARAINGEAITQPHRSHAYQRRVQRGWSHVRSAALVAVVSALCGAAGLIATQTDVGIDMLLGGFAVALCAVTVVAGRRQPAVTIPVGAGS